MKLRHVLIAAIAVALIAILAAPAMAQQPRPPYVLLRPGVADSIFAAPHSACLYGGVRGDSMIVTEALRQPCSPQLGLAVQVCNTDEDPATVVAREVDAFVRDRHWLRALVCGQHSWWGWNNDPSLPPLPRLTLGPAGRRT